MTERKAQITKIEKKTKSGSTITVDYAKVADRMKLFRADAPHGKHESAYEVDVDGSLVFTVWLWKDKSQLLELMKSGVSDVAVLRSSADAMGNAKGKIGGAEKEFEKLESIALGRALANLGYFASGEIASFEEMEAYYEYKQHQVDEAVAQLMDCETLEDLKKVYLGFGPLGAEKTVYDAKEAMKAKLAKPVEAKSE